jgi:hypothetical protein
MIEKAIKIILTLLLFLCLLDIHYGFYQFVRFVALIGFGVLAYIAKENNKSTEMIIYGSLALLFQPFLKVALGRKIWNIIDLIIGLSLMLSLFNNKYIKHEQ